jgi:hypothetical protein
VPASVARGSQPTRTPEGAARFSASAAVGTSSSTHARCPSGSDSTIAQIAGTAVSSPAIRRLDASAGGCHSKPPVGPPKSAFGPTSTTSSPSRASSAQADAGPVAPCSTKSTSTSTGSLRTARTV